MNERSSELTSPCGRSFKTSLAQDAVRAIQSGTMKMTYRNRMFLKSPMDIALYMRLLERLRPRTIIEIGAKRGGSALWFADMSTTLQTDAQVISIDRQPPKDLSDPRISLMTADAAALGHVLTPDVLARLPHPWLVSEDSAHTFDVCLAVLNFFDKYLLPEDYIVIEDGIVDSLPGLSRYENGPNHAVAAFLKEHREHYVIDADLCDQFGHNVTYNPNGWLRRVKS